jgi:hypothetical protein
MCPSIFNQIYKPLILAEVLPFLKVRTIVSLQYLQLQDFRDLWQFLILSYPILFSWNYGTIIWKALVFTALLMISCRLVYDSAWTGLWIHVNWYVILCRPVFQWCWCLPFNVNLTWKIAWWMLFWNNFFADKLTKINLVAAGLGLPR